MKQKMICLLLFLLLAGVYIWTNEKVSFYLLMAMVFLVGFSVISNWLGAKSLHVEVITEASDNYSDQQKGTESGDSSGRPKEAEFCQYSNGQITVLFHNTGIFPVFSCLLRMEIMNLLTDSTVEIERRYLIGPFAHKSDRIPVDALFCGRVETDIKQLECRDGLGLTKIPCQSQSKGYFYRYPEIQQLEMDSLLQQRIQNTSQEIYLNRKGNDPTEVLDIRDYQRGDSVKMIHWKLSAKWKKKMVRELDMPSNQDTLLVFALQGETDGEAVHRLVEYVLSVSQGLLQENIHHDALLLNSDGSLIRIYSIEGEESYGAFEKRILNGGIALAGEEVNSYLARHESVWRYSSILYISETEPPEFEGVDGILYVKMEDQAG